MAFLMDYNGGKWNTFAGGYVKDGKIISTTPIFDEYRPRMTPPVDMEEYKPRMTPPKKKQPDIIYYRGSTHDENDIKNGVKDGSVEDTINKAGKKVNDTIQDIKDISLFPKDFSFESIEKYLIMLIGVLGLSVVLKIIK